MPKSEEVRSIYKLLDDGDVDGVLALLAPDAKIFIPGSTRVSGDHEGDARRRALADVASVSGGVRRALLDCKENEHGIDVTMHDYVGPESDQHGYHAIHQFEIRDGKLAYWWWYPHEYDEFERAWG
jgi:ketosteroid isomerase-like protein